ncbi:hypothetical protein Bca4012_088133 [Brassica carinata]
MCLKKTPKRWSMLIESFFKSSTVVDLIKSTYIPAKISICRVLYCSSGMQSTMSSSCSAMDSFISNFRFPISYEMVCITSAFSISATFKTLATLLSLTTTTESSPYEIIHNLTVVILLLSLSFNFYIFPSLQIFLILKFYKTKDWSSLVWILTNYSLVMISKTWVKSHCEFPNVLSVYNAQTIRKLKLFMLTKNIVVKEPEISRWMRSTLVCLLLTLSNIHADYSDHESDWVSGLEFRFMDGNIDGRVQEQRRRMIGVVIETCPLRIIVSLSVVIAKNINSGCIKPPVPPSKGQLVEDRSMWRLLSSYSCINSDVILSDSDFSDMAVTYSVFYSSVKDLCQADSKSFTTQWMTLVPTNDVLKPRKLEATLMTCLLFDPHLKVRIASASALSTMMDGASSIFLQVAEYKESSKYGSFTPLSNSLGLVLMQLHTGILHLIHRDNHGRLLIQLFRFLLLLISSTPYSRMPGELLPKVIMSLHARITEGFSFKNDQTGLLVAAIGCLTAAFSTFPPQMNVHNMLLDETSAGFDGRERKSGVIFTLFRFAEQYSDASTCIEALQVLRAMALNYPTIVSACWERVSVLVYKLLQFGIVEDSGTTWKASVKEPVGFIGDKILTAAIKVLDGCLRAISGFKGNEDLHFDRIIDTPFTSDCIRSIRISSAPSYGFENPEIAQEQLSQAGCYQWSEAIRKHIVLVLHSGSAVVRSTAVTCFAGITSSVFVSFSQQEREFVTSSIINAALHDKSPSVRSAACRAIGVVSCFPETSLSIGIYEKFILAVEANTRDPLISVRVTASWALANVCEALRYRVNDTSFGGSNTTSQVVDSLIECALRLTEDGDKVKANAVRALGSISKYVKLRCMTSNHDVLPSVHHHLSGAVDSSWLERTVQAFLSCVTTGNVKVQWNVCHALSNLFSNETVKLQDMDWAPSVFSILLLLLRDASNFKIRIQAAAALAVPVTPLAYGRSFPDVVKGVWHTLQNLNSDRETTPTNFKYKKSLENQLTSTMLHLLSLVSSGRCEALTDFLLKKASFLEEWLRGLCVTLKEEDNASGSGSTSTSGEKQKKELISRAIRSLARSLEAGHNPEMALKLQELDSNLN